MKNELTLAGYKFTLKNIQYGIHSEETVDYMADLYCNGKLIATVENDGHGGCSMARWNHDNLELVRQVEQDVRKVVWLTCKDGTELYYTLGQVADDILELIERNKEISRLQKNALVLEKEDSIYFSTLEYKNSIKDILTVSPKILELGIRRAKKDGWTIVNTNIPAKLLAIEV